MDERDHADAVNQGPEGAGDADSLVAERNLIKLGKAFLDFEDPVPTDLNKRVAAAMSMPEESYLLSPEKYKDLTKDLPTFKVFDWVPREVAPHLLRSDQRSGAAELFWAQKRDLDITRYALIAVNDLDLLLEEVDPSSPLHGSLEAIQLVLRRQLRLCLNAVQTERQRLRSMVRDNVYPTPWSHDSGRESAPAVTADEMDDLVLEAKRARQVQLLIEQRGRPKRSSGRGRRGQRRSRRGFSSFATPSSTKSEKAPQKSRGGEAH